MAGFLLAQIPLLVAIHRWQADLSGEIRNPGHRRGWFEYVRATTQPNPGLEVILILSNSQGYGAEVPARHIYANRLQTNLRMADRPARVVNWSAPGATYFDLLVLAAAARDLKPDHILFVLTPAPLCEPTRDRIEGEHWTSDSHYLLSDAALRSRLAEDRLSKRLSTGTWADIYLGGYWPVWRWHGWIPSRLAQVPRLGPLFPTEKDSTWFPPPTIFGRQSMPPHAALNVAATQRLLGLLREASPDICIVDMPLVESWRAADAAREELHRIAAEFSFRHLDLSSAIGEEGFITSTHFNSRGHLLMGRLLMDALP